MATGDEQQFKELQAALAAQNCTAEAGAEPSPPGSKGALKEWELDACDLALDEQVGIGSTAEVFRGRWKEQVVAIKNFNVDPAHMHAKARQNLQRELAIMRRVRHPRIVNLVGIVMDQRPFRIVMEYCEGGTVFELVHNREDVDPTWTQRVKMITDVSEGMQYLHSFEPQIIHRDLKSLNLLLESMEFTEATVPSVRIADMGVSRMQEVAAVPMTKAAGSVHWMAPEVHSGSAYDASVDVYSFAMITYEIVCREIPFEEIPNQNLIGLAAVKGRRPTMDLVPQDCPEFLPDLMQRCWDAEPSQRPCFADTYQLLLQQAASLLD